MNVVHDGDREFDGQEGVASCLGLRKAPKTEAPPSPAIAIAFGIEFFVSQIYDHAYQTLTYLSTRW